MPSILLTDQETSIILTDAELTIRYVRKKNPGWLFWFIYTGLICMWVAIGNIGWGEWAIITFIAIISKLAFDQVTELTFNKDDKKVYRHYLFYGKKLKTQVILNNYENLSYLVGYDEQSNGESSASGYFFNARYGREHILLYLFKTIDDAELVTNILNKELNLNISLHYPTK